MRQNRFARHKCLYEGVVLDLKTVLTAGRSGAIGTGTLGITHSNRHTLCAKVVAHEICNHRQLLVESHGAGERLGELVKADGLAKGEVLALKALLFEGATQHPHNLLWFERLEDVVKRTALHCIDSCLDRTKTSHDDGHGVSLEIGDASDEIEAVDARHLQVSENQIELVRAKYPEGVLTTGRSLYVKTLEFEKITEDVADDRLVVDHEDLRFSSVVPMFQQPTLHPGLPRVGPHAILD